MSLLLWSYINNYVYRYPATAMGFMVTSRQLQ
jgi:hypothetical protein